MAGLLVPTTTAEAQVHDPLLKNVLAVIDGADPKILGPLGPGEGLQWGELAAGEILAQYTGPDFELGGRRSTEELDAFAEELIARRIANPDGTDIVFAFRIAGIVEPDDPHHIRYERAFDALRRLYEAGVMVEVHPFSVDPVRVVEYLLGRLQERKMDVTEACLLLLYAYDHGKITLEADGSLSFEPGGVQAVKTRPCGALRRRLGLSPSPRARRQNPLRPTDRIRYRPTSQVPVQGRWPAAGVRQEQPT